MRSAKQSGYIVEGKSRDLFIKRFGKPIEAFGCYKIAVEPLKPKSSLTYLKVLPNYFLFLDQDPDEVVAQRKMDLLSAENYEYYERKTTLYLKALVERGKAGFYISSQLGRIQGFFTNNGKRLRLDMGRLRISKARKHRKYSPSNEEVRIIFGKADSARDRLVVALMYQNGPAPIDVSLLCCGDYPLEAWQYFERSRSKTGEVWRGISMPDVCECLRAYLNVRGNFKLGEPLFVGREGPLNSEGISQVVHDLIERAGFGKVVGFKPTSLRDAFEDALVDAEIYHKVKEALMAHNSGIEQEYGGYNRMIERLTDAVKKTYSLLCLNDVNKNDASLAGLTRADVDALKEIRDNLDVYREVLSLVKSRKFVHVDDPDLPERLRKEGKIK
jgi:hypothetical protein